MKLIQIKRSCCPPILKNAAADSDRYPHRSVVSELWKMQAGKCCYCERKIPEKGQAKTVEHFKPKSKFKAQRNHWPNLLLACPQCNGKKADQFPWMPTINPDEVKLNCIKRHSKKGKEVPALIDPSKKQNPEVHLNYYVDLMNDGPFAGQIFPRDESLYGKATISVIGLDQAFFHRLRRAHFLTLVRTYVALLEANDQDGRQAALLQFNNLISRGGVFAGLAREFARKVKLDLRYDLHIPTIA